MNTNPKARRILCFGDSNTWGYISGTNHFRLDSNKRWPGVLQQLFGTENEIIEEGLNSRAINSEDGRPGKNGRNATQYVLPCLDTHDPLDWIIIMLGSNELKYEYNFTSEEIAASMKVFIQIVQNTKSQFRDIQPKILLVSPPLLNENTDYCRKNNKYLGATEKSRELAGLYKKLAEDLRIQYINASLITEPGIDGVHITEESHKRLAEEIYKAII